jgi:hypothetical protein
MDYVQFVENLRKDLLVLYSKLIPYSEGTDISTLLEKIDCKLFKLGKALYGNTVYMLNNPISAVDIIDLLNYKRILTFRQVNPNYCANLNMLTGEMIGDVVQWNQTNLIYGTGTQVFWFNKIIKNAIFNNTTFADILIPPLIITTITIDNLTTNAFQLVIQLTDGTELFNDLIDASALLTLTLNSPVKVLNGINITSPDWNNAVINLSIATENPF